MFAMLTLTLSSLYEMTCNITACLSVEMNNILICFSPKHYFMICYVLLNNLL